MAFFQVNAFLQRNFLACLCFFLQVKSSFLHLYGSFLQIVGGFLQVDGSFLQVGGGFLQVDGSFLQVGGGFLQIDGSFLQVDGSFMQLVATFCKLIAKCICNCRVKGPLDIMLNQQRLLNEAVIKVFLSGSELEALSSLLALGSETTDSVVDIFFHILITLFGITSVLGTSVITLQMNKKMMAINCNEHFNVKYRN